MKKLDVLSRLPAALNAGRRRWLQQSSGVLAGAFGATSLGGLLLASRPAAAADYKALVCVFLSGGNDGMNMIVPTDSSRYNQYAAVRGPLALPSSQLLRLAGSNYGLHPALSALTPYWNNGYLAPVFNLGPLAVPLTKAQYRAEPDGSPLIPGNLFSHSDQQLLWESAGGDTSARTGWGGRASGVMNTVNPVISVGGNGVFGVETERVPLVLPGPGQKFGAFGLMPEDMTWTPRILRRAAIDKMYGQAQTLQLGNAYNTQQRDAFEISERIGSIVSAMPGSSLSSPAIDNAFAPLMRNGAFTTYLSAQLYQVAKLISNNATVQGNRQIFLAQLGGFDTHSDQLVLGNPTTGTHADLLREAGDALAAFQRAIDNMGMAGSVTTFTQADFGRTFQPNMSNGTDHAWGNHQFVMGGAVKGKATYGTYPELVIGGPDDVGVETWERQGRWIPTSSVDQYASTLLGWFGAGGSQIDQILPNLRNFSRRTLGFL
jgi:uncharacterized protein (DUF1501 family)